MSPQLSSSSGRSSLSPKRKVIALIALIAVVALIAGTAAQLSGVFSGSDESPSAADKQDSGGDDSSAQGNKKQFAELAKLARRQADDPFAQGKKDAPVVMIEYADFQCPFCQKFATSTERDLVKKYVKSGVLRIEWRNFPIFGKESKVGAKASYAAAQQDRFWQFHQAVYKDSPKGENTGYFTKKKMVQVAKKAGVKDLDTFRKDYASSQAKSSISKDSDEGYQLGVTSTPAFLINGRPLLGAQPKKQFESTIEKAHKAAKKKAAKEKDAPEGSDKQQGGADK